MLDFFLKTIIIKFVTKKLGTLGKQVMSGSDGEKVTPVPIPNTEVKLLSADGSWGIAPARVGRRQAIPFHSSSVVEQSAVNRSVVGSNPTCGAMESCPSGRRSTIGNRVGCESGLEGSNPSLSATLNYFLWPVGQAVKTPPFHGGNTGSNPVRVTKWRISSAGRAPALQAGGRRFEPCILHHFINNTFKHRGVEQSGSSSGS